MKRYSLLALDALLYDPPERTKRQPRTEEHSSSSRPGDVFNETFSVGTVLSWLEFEPAHSDSQGEHWVRPGKSARDGSSVTVYDDDEGQHATIWSDTVTGWYPAAEVRRPYDAFGLFVVTHHDGDFAAANRALLAEGFGEPRDDGGMREFLAGIEADIRGERVLEASAEEEEKPAGSSWRAISGRLILAGNPEPPPSLFRRADGVCLLYRGRVNIFQGEPETAKSWGAQVALVECIKAGGKGCMIDFENSAYSVRDRMLPLGLSEDEFCESFFYVHPEEPLNEASAYQLREELKSEYDLIVVDGVTDGMALLGLDTMANMDAATFDRTFLRVLAASGAAVVVIDHVTKSRDNRGSWAIGAQHKKSACTGAQYLFEKIHDFGRGMKGMSRLIVAKDKPGYVNQEYVGEKLIAEFWLDGTTPGVVTPSLLVPTAASQVTQVSASLMELLSNYISINPGMKRDSIFTGCGSTVETKFLKAAFDKLRVDGYIADDMKLPDCWRTVKPFTVIPADWSAL